MKVEHLLRLDLHMLLLKRVNLATDHLDFLDMPSDCVQHPCVSKGHSKLERGATSGEY
jgi:hypothetical protein